MLDDNIENSLVNICRVPQKDRIYEDVKRQVILFWTTHSCVSSNRCDTIKIKDQEVGEKIEHPKHFIDINQSELFQTFKQQFSNVKICQRKLESFHPSFLCINKMHKTCCFRNHVEFVLHLQS